MKSIRQLLWQIPVALGASAFLSNAGRALPDASGDADRQYSQIGEVQVKLKNDRIYFSQNAGRTFQELEVTRTPEAVRLKRLLEKEDSAGLGRVAKVRPTMVADGAGGSPWARPKEDAPNGAAEAEAPKIKPVAGKDAVEWPKGSVQLKPK